MTEGDLLIRGGTVADGSGGDPKLADVLVRDGRIAAVERPGVVPTHGLSVLDATGLVVAPGFIDTHSHGDNVPLLTEDDTSKILQGVTTEVVGNCGGSLTPLSASTSRRTFPGMESTTWLTWEDCMAQLDALGYVTNYAPLVGHGNLRSTVLGMADAKPGSAELDAMGLELDRTLEGGAFGMSSGLVYTPGTYSDTEELVALARHLGADGLYVTHVRGEAGSLLQAIAEAVRIGMEGKTRLHISHLKCSGRPNWGQMPIALSAIHAAANDGLGITKDIYPYAAGSTSMLWLLPPPFLADGDAAVMARLESAEQRRQLATVMKTGLPGWDAALDAVGWDGILVSTTASHHYEGRTIAELSRELNESPLDVMIRILREEQLNADIVTFTMHEDDVRAAFVDPDTMVGSDGWPHGGGGKPHPRMYGTFPRILAEYVRKESVVSLGEAIRRMTSLPAETFRIPDRGYVRPGLVADLVAFDLNVVDHECDYRDPLRTPTGIAWVMQAGHTVVNDTTYVGPRRGRRLTPA